MPDTTLIVNNGLAVTTDRLRGLGAEPKFLGWGTGAGTTAVADSALFGESTEARATCTTASVQTTVLGDTFRAAGTLTAAATKTITNCGIFDAVTGGRLFVKSSFDPIPLNAGDSITFTINCQYRT